VRGGPDGYRSPIPYCDTPARSRAQATSRSSCPLLTKSRTCSASGRTAASSYRSAGTKPSFCQNGPDLREKSHARVAPPAAASSRANRASRVPCRAAPSRRGPGRRPRCCTSRRGGLEVRATQPSRGAVAGWFEGERMTPLRFGPEGYRASREPRRRPREPRRGCHWGTDLPPPARRGAAEEKGIPSPRPPAPH